MGLAALDDMPFAPEAPREIVKYLQEIDPNLNFIYLPIGPGCWAYTEKWGIDDPRRSRIQSGELPPNKDFDVLGFAPTDVTAEDAAALLLKQLRGKITEAPEYQKMLNSVIAHNAAVRDRNVAPTREFAAEMLDANSGKTISRGAGFSVEGDRVVGTPVTQKRGLTPSERDAKVEG